VRLIKIVDFPTTFTASESQFGTRFVSHPVHATSNCQIFHFYWWRRLRRPPPCETSQLIAAPRSSQWSGRVHHHGVHGCRSPEGVINCSGVGGTDADRHTHIHLQPDRRVLQAGGDCLRQTAARQSQGRLGPPPRPDSM
jgi:hypothetical protein